MFYLSCINTLNSNVFRCKSNSVDLITIQVLQTGFSLLQKWIQGKFTEWHHVQEAHENAKKKGSLRNEMKFSHSFLETCTFGKYTIWVQVHWSLKEQDKNKEQECHLQLGLPHVCIRSSVSLFHGENNPKLELNKKVIKKCFLRYIFFSFTNHQKMNTYDVIGKNQAISKAAILVPKKLTKLNQ